MEVLEYGNRKNKIILLIHGFESPYQIWEKYIEAFKEEYCILVPILPGHNIKIKEDFHSLECCVKELEDYYINQFGNEIYAVYGMSMGGVIACSMWQNQRIKIKKLILESSPLGSWSKLLNAVLTKQYLIITHLAQKRNKLVVKQAVNSMVTEEYLECFLELLDHISDKTIVNYLNEIRLFKLNRQFDNNTELYYYHGTMMNEYFAIKTAKLLKKKFDAKIICFKGKGHCEDALLNPLKRIEELRQVLM